jgi:hypothetical protein
MQRKAKIQYIVAIQETHHPVPVPCHMLLSLQQAHGWLLYGILGS